MMDFISVPLVVGIVFLGVYKLFELFVCRSERLKIIEKMGENFSPVDVIGKLRLPSYQQSRFSFGTLKGGCLMLGIGLGLLLGFAICFTAIPEYPTNNSWDYRETTSIIYGACVLLCGGFTLLIAFIIEMIIGKKKGNE